MTPKGETLHYVVINRSGLGDLAADALDGDARAMRVLEAITNWDAAAARCINCRVAPLQRPEAFIVVLKDSEIWAAGICERCCIKHEGKLVELAHEHLHRLHSSSMRMVTPGGTA
jgi:hypothetical protein